MSEPSTKPELPPPLQQKRLSLSESGSDQFTNRQLSQVSELEQASKKFLDELSTSRPMLGASEIVKSSQHHTATANANEKDSSSSSRMYAEQTSEQQRLAQSGAAHSGSDGSSSSSRIQF